MKKQTSSLIFSLMEWLKRLRYIKFGLVGASGTVVNMAVLYLAQEYLFAIIGDPRQRLYASLALAIAVATINNFTWNRLWTWADRVKAAHVHHQHLEHTRLVVIAGQLGRYALASWLGIALQYGLTLWLAQALHYLLANVIAILVASVSNFIANDRWTFRHRAP
jgi:dolichol-phosphate mannosyltransferase